MRKQTIALVLIMLAATSQMIASAKAPVHTAIKDVSTLVEKLIEVESYERATVNDIKDLMNDVETLAEPYFQGKNSYYIACPLNVAACACVSVFYKVCN